jgi:hypothetical protein
MDLAARKYHFIEELLKVESESLMSRLEKVLKSDNGIPETHRQILDERLEHYKNNPSDLLDWNSVKENW